MDLQFLKGIQKKFQKKSVDEEVLILKKKLEGLLIEAKTEKTRERMQTQELITCSCGNEYTANNTLCFKCGKKTIETLWGMNG